MLSDPQRRDRYDMGEDEDGQTEGGGMGGSGAFSNADLAEIFAQFQGGPFSGGGGFGGGGFHFHAGGNRHQDDFF